MGEVQLAHTNGGPLDQTIWEEGLWVVSGQSGAGQGVEGRSGWLAAAVRAIATGLSGGSAIAVTGLLYIYITTLVKFGLPHACLLLQLSEIPDSSLHIPNDVCS